MATLLDEAHPLAIGSPSNHVRDLLGFEVGVVVHADQAQSLGH